MNIGDLLNPIQDQVAQSQLSPPHDLRERIPKSIASDSKSTIRPYKKRHGEFPLEVDTDIGSKRADLKRK
jgi:hypothetical protein